MMNFLDTSSLLKCSNLESLLPFCISSITLLELENIKISANKSEQVKFDARQVTRWLKEHDGEYTIVMAKPEYKSDLINIGLEPSNDNLIAYCAEIYNADYEAVIFYTEDLLLSHIAKTYFNLRTAEVKSNHDDVYVGYKTVVANDEQLALMYDKDNRNNVFDCITNQYVVIKDSHGYTVDVFKWNGERYTPMTGKNLKSVAFGDKLKAKDEYQRMAIDSLLSNDITAISGHSGSGKSLLCLMAAMHLIDTGKYDRLVVLFNPCPARGATQMGYYSGDSVEKAMQSNIGHILVTKFGDRFVIDNMINSGKLKLVPMVDCRGMEIRDSEILWITEAENTTSDLMKLCLSRVATGAKVFIEGDYDQIDHRLFETNNGLRRAVEVLKGNIEFGFVELQNIWRSRIAELVDKM